MPSQEQIRTQPTISPLNCKLVPIPTIQKRQTSRAGTLAKMRRFCYVIIGQILISWVGFGQDTVDLCPDQPGALICWTETRSTPRILRIHYLKVALNAHRLEVFALPGEDPDGPGPAESQLTRPIDLFKKFHALAAINANAFAGLPNDQAAGPDWYEGRPVDIHGMVVSGRKVISPIENNRTSFWLDTLQKPHIGTPPSMDLVAEAVSDWLSPLLIDSRIIPDPSDHALHPRTALGFDDTATWLLLVVVDGRQPGFSEGVWLYELARILQLQGCSQSINLDGGGSSIMLIQESGKEVRTVNSPSGGAQRPLPVMLGVRRVLEQRRKADRKNKLRVGRATGPCPR